MVIAARRESEVLPTEVSVKGSRRRFSAEYKRRIVREADSCSEAGEVGKLLRREGLYSSHLTSWRSARDRGELEGLAPKKRGRKAKQRDARDERITELEGENTKLRAGLERAQIIIELQKKMAELAGTPLTENDEVK